jgi:NADPH-dependent 2,4-dienoyl-CoA reductase/sulfur reductase-like enzyme
VTIGSIVVVGGGQAGGRCIEALRQRNFPGPITLVSDEPHWPYERPPLSKDVLADRNLSRMAWVRPESWWTEQKITRHASRAEYIDRDAHTLTLLDGTIIPYGALVLATGARPRIMQMPGFEHPAILTIRTPEDSEKLIPHLRPDAHIVIIGAGFIGLEVAAAARAHGAAVTVLEIANRVMARGVPEEVSDWYAALHREKGVDLRLGAVVTRITDASGKAIVHTEDGATITADAVVIGIGVIPNVELAESAGLETHNGIVVDQYGRTADPAIWAAGDVTHHPNDILGCHLRLESWQNAQNQAIAVARNILGDNKPYTEAPWFWSDQFGHNMQLVGLPEGNAIGRGTFGAGPVLRFYLTDGIVRGAIGIDAGRDIRFAKDLVALRASIPPAELSDPAVKLVDVVKRLKAARAAA